MRIRPPHPAELPLLRDVERAAGERFRDIGMAEIAADEPLQVDELEQYRRAGRAWVATEAGERDADGGPPVVAYLLADRIDGNLHVEQVSVHPAAARRGVGRALLEHLATVARAAGIPALTLTTFADVPWNAPYYERCGFRRLAVDEITPELRAVREREAAHGLDRWPRVCMRREV
ncbi:MULTISPECIES: GNAT family N-acetyltransferase [Streptomyces]|uniref:GNAT family N-acetyltransferase n=1 Tax=Streptomyces TaxID=1883 RepID=UPI00163C5EDD|nr:MULTISPECIES: GNAT family N-acetyltransferase [Streptomyces]MBC2877585.1 GNAT family N-acetyltransferase [Streptomyces sp. TYQ1024]UBI36176.1 GNAT family N-acetyltransferase [Streptomyces mobaraensis]UKW28770.1 GNAT family N-acetyltransferase [Streptomyces sp. TYQ1024]